MNTKWIWVILLIIVGIIAAVFAGEYLTTGIGHLPSWVPGHHPGHRGHMHKRGYALVLVAVVAFAGAGWFIFKIVKEGEPAVGKEAEPAVGAQAEPAVGAQAAEAPPAPDES